MPTPSELDKLLRSSESLAAQLQCSLAEVERLRRRLEPATRRRRVALVAALMGAAVVGAVPALAQTCTVVPAIWAPGLVPFCADQPALASEVTGNFSRIVELVQGKVGALATPGVQAPALAVSGSTALNGGATITGGPLAAQAVSTRIIRVVPSGSVTLPAAGTYTDTDLTTTFSLDAQKTIDLSYMMTGEQLGVGFMVTRVLIDGTEAPEARCVNGSHLYFQNTGRVLTRLAAGSHTVTVQYRANGTVRVDTASDFMGRALLINVFGS